MEVLTIGEKIKKARKAMKYTLRDVAGNVVTPAQLSYIESGKCRPSGNLLRYLCEKMNLDMEYITESEACQAEELCIYYLNEYELYTRNGNDKEARDVLELVEKTASEYNLMRYIGVSAYQKGLNTMIWENNISARYCFQSALQSFLKCGDYRGMCDCFYMLGTLELKVGCIEDAIIYFTRAAGLIEVGNICDSSFILKILAGIVEAYFRIGNTNECMKNTINFYKKINQINGGFNCYELEEYGRPIDVLISAFEKNEQFDEAILLKLIKVMYSIENGEVSKTEKYISGILTDVVKHVSVRAQMYLIEFTAYLLKNEINDQAHAIIDYLKGNLSTVELNAKYHYLLSVLYASTDNVRCEENLLESEKYADKISDGNLKYKINTALARIYAINGKNSELVNCLSKDKSAWRDTGLPFEILEI